LENTHIGKESATALATAANAVFQATQNQDAIALGKAMTASFNAQIAMFPNMTSPEINQTIHELYAMHPWVLGHKLSGAGGGGYLVLFAEQPIPNTLQIKIRRAEH
jgi:galactokinase/mevalonate kinase-like predicted kinase